MFDISFIIPVYNVEPYLAQCIESVKGLKEKKAQIICIDDRSTDNSYNALLQMNSDRKIEIYRNEINLGLSGTRNRGIGLAKGEYVCFVDSDDYIVPENIERIVSFAQEEKLDLVCYDALEFDENSGALSEKRRRKGTYETGTGAALCAEMRENGEMFGSVCSILFKREFLEKNRIGFIEGILHEDIPFTFECMMKAERAGVVREIGYYYRQRTGSIMHDDNLSRRLHGLLRAYFKMLELWDEKSRDIEAESVKSGILSYIDSVVDLLHYDLDMCEWGTDDLLLKNFFGNFVIKESREAERILSGVTIEELRAFRRVALYGAGRFAKKVTACLRNYGITVDSVFVTKKNPEQQEFENVPVHEYSGEKIKKYDAVIVAVADPAGKSISDMLAKAGYEGMIIPR